MADTIIESHLDSNKRQDEADIAEHDVKHLHVAPAEERKHKKRRSSKRRHREETEEVAPIEKATGSVEKPVEEKRAKKKTKKPEKSDTMTDSTEDTSSDDEKLPPRVGPTHDRDVPGVVNSFNSCIVRAKKTSKHGLPEDINIGRFVQAFQDLLPILRLLGTAFYFVEQDIVQKLTAITENQEKQKNAEYAVNLIDFLAWEKETNPKILHDKHSSARHTLRLMRALHFISLFLDKLNTPGVEPKPAAKEAYATSLAHYHPWSVRTAVSVAFYTLPYRKSFCKHLHLDPDAENIFGDFVQATTRIRDILNVYYDANGWQSLP